MNELNNEMENRFLIFNLNNKLFGMPLLEVKEVIGFIKPMAIPKTPDYFKGIINLRDTVISVIDLAEKFKVPRSEDEKERSIIILNSGSYGIGVIVDSIHSVISFKAEELDTTPKFESLVGKKFIQSVGRKDNQLFLIIDVMSILSSEDFNLLQKKSA